MNKKDLVIMSHLRANSREILASISRKTHIPISTIHDRIKAGIGGCVSKFSTLLNYDKLGFGARANVIVKVAREDKKTLQEYLEKHPHVNSLFKINNGYDFMFEGVFKTLIEFEEFVELLEDKFDIQQKEVYYIMGDIKRESFMSDPEQIRLVDV